MVKGLRKSKELSRAIEVYSYIIAKINKPSFFSETDKVNDYQEEKEALRQFHEINQSSDSFPAELDMWIERYLTQKYVERLNAALRQRKRRAMGRGKTITISSKAHRMITLLAEADDLTISEAIEKRLSRSYSAELRRKYESE